MDAPPEPTVELPPDADPSLGEVGLHPLHTNAATNATTGKVDHFTLTFGFIVLVLSNTHSAAERPLGGSP